VIAATNRDIRQMVAASQFQEDLYYRLNVIPIHMPPLRERREDIPLLVDHFVRKHAQRAGKRIEGLEPGVLDALQGADWPGNVRELENTLESLVALSSEGEVDLGLLPEPEPSAAPEAGAQAAEPMAKEPGRGDGWVGVGLKERVEAYERGLILDALRLSGGNRSEAARRLGIGRATLHDKLRKYGLEVPSPSPGEAGPEE
jgi:two-component system, NtrC family, response regulator HydG